MLAAAGGSRRRSAKVIAGAFGAVIFLATSARAQNISTAAGNGTAGFSGDGGAAVSASLNRPQGVGVDALGNFYIVDTDNHRIRKVSAAGVISTVAGSGVAGFSGDGGPATSASLSFPRAVALDGDGNLFIADRNNSRIRKVLANGTITTVAGNGANGFSGDNGPATGANLGRPFGVAVAANGEIYIADTNNQRVRKVAVNGVISTVAGNGTDGDSGDGGPATSASLNFPFRVTVDSANNLFVSSGERIRKVTPAGVISTFAGNGVGGFSGDGGPATNASLNSPDAVALDAAGAVYIVDSFNSRVRKVTPDGIINTIAGDGNLGFGGDGGPAISATLFQPNGIAINAAGTLYIGDFGNNRVRRIAPAATPAQRLRELITFIGALGLPAATRSGLQAPLGAVVAVLESGSASASRAACAQLGAYVPRIERLAARGALGDADAVAIIVQVDSVRRQLGCSAPA